MPHRMVHIVAFVASLGLAAAGCSAATWQGVAQGLAQASAAQNAGELPKLMLFGGLNHKTYLGCVNCSEFASDSIFNEYGLHGSEYATESVVNPYSQFGSPYSSYSACSPYASDPPVIVDGNGEFYGRLTMNHNHPQATRNESLVGWLVTVCSD